MEIRALIILKIILAILVLLELKVFKIVVLLLDLHQLPVDFTTHTSIIDFCQIKMEMLQYFRIILYCQYHLIILMVIKLFIQEIINKMWEIIKNKVLVQEIYQYLNNPNKALRLIHKLDINNN